jgi:hypothetical protein
MVPAFAGAFSFLREFNLVKNRIELRVYIEEICLAFMTYLYLLWYNLP